MLAPLRKLGKRRWQGGNSIDSPIGLNPNLIGLCAEHAVATTLYLRSPALRYCAALQMLPALSLALASVMPGRTRKVGNHPWLLVSMIGSMVVNGAIDVVEGRRSTPWGSQALKCYLSISYENCEATLQCSLR